MSLSPCRSPNSDTTRCLPSDQHKTVSGEPRHTMQPNLFSFGFGSHSPGCTSKLIFFMFAFGGMLFCAGFVLSVFGFQTCQMSSFSTCNMAFKVVGPSLAAIGLASILLARSKSRLEHRRRVLSGDSIDPDHGFLCGESRQFVQFLVFGFLFVTSGILVSVLGAWIPGCTLTSQNVNGTVTNSRHCDFLSLQIMGPLIVLIGLSFFVAAHINKKHGTSDGNESSVDDLETSRDEPFHITVGDEIILFPPPPPSYFAESSITRHGCSTDTNENPPSYNSIFSQRAHPDGHNSVSDPENIYTIPMSSQPADAYFNEHFPLDPPPKYEEKDPPEPASEQSASPPLSTSLLPEAASSDVV